jgi:predicted Zn finger-like uncharacterized protein
MPLTIQCPHCQRSLNVPDEAAGKMVRCPACQEAFAVAQPTPTVTPAPPEPTAPAAAWDKESSAERRQRDGEEKKKRKRKRYDDDDEEDKQEEEEEERPRKSKAADDNPFALQNDEGQNRPPPRPHRAGTIMALGILSLLFACVPMAFITVSMANVDLIQMAALKMDPEGKTMTKVGKYLAMASFLWIFLGCLLGCVFGLLRAGVRW